MMMGEEDRGEGNQNRRIAVLHSSISKREETQIKTYFRKLEDHVGKQEIPALRH